MSGVYSESWLVDLESVQKTVIKGARAERGGGGWVERTKKNKGKGGEESKNGNFE